MKDPHYFNHLASQVAAKHEGFEEVLAMSHEDLDQVEFTLKKWTCCVKGCSRFTRVRDYGVAPAYFWRKKWIFAQGQIFFCGQHWKTHGKKPAADFIKDVAFVDLVEL